jgi:hypothetical protein
MTPVLHLSGLPMEQFEAFVSLYKSLIDQLSDDDRKVFLAELRDELPSPYCGSEECSRRHQ